MPLKRKKPKTKAKKKVLKRKPAKSAKKKIVRKKTVKRVVKKKIAAKKPALKKRPAKFILAGKRGGSQVIEAHIVDESGMVRGSISVSVQVQSQLSVFFARWAPLASRLVGIALVLGASLVLVLTKLAQ